MLILMIRLDQLQAQTGVRIAQRQKHGLFFVGRGNIPVNCVAPPEQKTHAVESVKCRAPL